VGLSLQITKMRRFLLEEGATPSDGLEDFHPQAVEYAAMEGEVALLVAELLERRGDHSAAETWKRRANEATNTSPDEYES
jgi:hypothetical protein